MYHPGVGSSDSVVDKFTGGLFGVGLDQAIREVYNFICTNYVDGDDIILIGFSRGAFTARSVADMIATVGLLTPSGLDHFYAIFEDYENMGESDRDPSLFLDPKVPPYNGEKGAARANWEMDRKSQYERWLSKNGLTRRTYEDANGVHEINIKAVGFSNTQVSDRVENAFHALSLDEPRFAFRPALWEKLEGNKTNLRQLLVIMAPAEATTAVGESQDMSGQIRYPTSRLQTWSGTTIRHPGTFMRTDPETNQDTDQPLLNTNERIHSSVRVRLACQGLAMDDDGVWDCKALATADDGSGLWKLERGSGLNASEADSVKDGKTRKLDLDAEGDVLKPYPVQKEDSQWKWVLASKHPNAFPLAGVLPEEPLTGYWERKLLALTAGNPDVWRWAEENPPFGLI
ncbi:peptidoglycan binding domain-containing protein [Colletotrichum lupini]|uniref:Peptidoglycan binding domain-containing protein n=1 Tax=Colletotrichum lupini TaxID=145971 RepID=A0A9Q8W9Z0_9PEZI|nr:peptidoglycan binding domain-containing protein [Colletotrichum lupini]UQC75639.1 peptidoglycan binding domain-containing protein [Colletotrichum lupini]